MGLTGIHDRQKSRYIEPVTLIFFLLRNYKQQEHQRDGGKKLTVGQGLRPWLCSKSSLLDKSHK
jgi:hypothetical protein